MSFNKRWKRIPQVCSGNFGIKISDIKSSTWYVICISKIMSMYMSISSNKDITVFNLLIWRWFLTILNILLRIKDIPHSIFVLQRTNIPKYSV